MHLNLWIRARFGTVTFKYDPAGRRVQKMFTQGSTSTTSNYVYDGKGPNLIEEVDNNGNVIARHIYSKAVDEPLAQLRSGTTSYYEADGLGSVTSLSSTAGALAQTYTFDSFGNTTNSTGSLTNRFEYTGRVRLRNQSLLLPVQVLRSQSRSVH